MPAERSHHTTDRRSRSPSPYHRRRYSSSSSSSPESSYLRRMRKRRSHSSSSSSPSPPPRNQLLSTDNLPQQEKISNQNNEKRREERARDEFHRGNEDKDTGVIEFSNVTKTVTEQHLHEILSLYGAIRSLELNSSYGNGIVIFEKKEDASRCLEYCSELQLDGRCVLLRYSRERRSKQYRGYDRRDQYTSRSYGRGNRNHY